MPLWRRLNPLQRGKESVSCWERIRRHIGTTTRRAGDWCEDRAVLGSLAALGSPARSRAPHWEVADAVETMGGIGAGEERAHLQGVGF